MPSRRKPKPLIDTRTDEEVIPDIRPRPLTSAEREAMARANAEELQVILGHQTLLEDVLARDPRTAEDEALLRELMPEAFPCEDLDCPDCRWDAQQVAVRGR